MHKDTALSKSQFGNIYLGKGWFLRFDLGNKYVWTRWVNLKILTLQQKLHTTL